MVCGESVQPKHWSDVDSQRLLSIVQQLLTQTFASAPCITLLEDHKSWLKICAEEVEVQLSSTIRLLRSRVELDHSLNLKLDQSHDPVTLMLLESKRKAFQMLVKMATAEDTSSACPSPPTNTATDASTAPASPSPSKVSRLCTAAAAQAASMHCIALDSPVECQTCVQCQNCAKCRICDCCTDCTLLQGARKRPADAVKVEESEQPKKLRHADSSKQVRVFMLLQHTVA